MMHQAERENAMQQIIVSRNDKEEVWVETPAGNVLAECFFKAPDETPEELEHMGYPVWSKYSNSLSYGRLCPYHCSHFDLFSAPPSPHTQRHYGW